MKWWPFSTKKERTKMAISKPTVCYLDGSYQTRQQVYQAIYSQLASHDSPGENLDALHDFLTGMAKGPLEIHWTHIGEAENNLGSDWVRIVDVLRDVALERPDFKLVLTSAKLC
jgi:ribonuclease inhibitor